MSDLNKEEARKALNEKIEVIEETFSHYNLKVPSYGFVSQTEGGKLVLSITFESINGVQIVSENDYDHFVIKAYIVNVDGYITDIFESDRIYKSDFHSVDNRRIGLNKKNLAYEISGVRVFITKQ